jgi:hypothetical protein
MQYDCKGKRERGKGKVELTRKIPINPAILALIATRLYIENQDAAETDGKDGA